jgi:putative peptidoglycan lipid II flippase
MTAVNASLEQRPLTAEKPDMRLGGAAALAESAWMGSVQASDVLEQLRAAPGVTTRQRVIPRLPRVSLKGLFQREFSVAEASFILMVSFFTSALMGAVRQVLFNAQFGAGMEANAYYAAFRLPDTLFSLIAGGALSSAMIPVLIKTSAAGLKASTRLANLVLTALLAVFALVVVIGIAFTPFFVNQLLAPGFDAPTSALTVRLTRIMLVQPLVLAVGSVATALLNSRNRFFATGLSVIGHNVALISGILAARVVPGLGILGPTLGVVAGALLQVIILLPGLSGIIAGFRPVWAPGDAGLTEVVRLLIPNGLSVGVNYSGFIVDTAFASKAPETAGLAALYNAWLLVGLPIALLGQAIGQAVFPRLASAAADGDWRGFRSGLVRSLGIAIGLALLALLSLVVLGRPVIQILFERGRFDAAAGDLTYQVLLTYSFGLPAYVATELVTRGLLALQDTRTPLLTNTLQLAGRAGLMFWLVSTVGIISIPLAFAITAASETILLSIVFFARINRRVRSAV